MRSLLHAFTDRLPHRFHFFDPGPMADGDLELVAPHQQHVDDVLAVCRHPLTERDAPEEARVTRDQLSGYLAAAPSGRQRGDASRGRVPQYDFWMLLRDGLPSGNGRSGDAPVRIAGGIGLRVGSTRNVEMYYGHIGYHVYPPARGHHYAERACRLLLPLARRHGLRTLWITCNPENAASRRTCERLGMTYVETVAIPTNDPLYARGEREKCRYRLEL